MNIKPAFRYQLSQHKAVIIILCAVTIVADLFMFFTAAPNTVTGAARIYGPEWILFILLAFISLRGFSDTFKMLNQNGVSRNSIFWSRVFSIIAASLVLSVLSIVLGVLTRLLCTTVDGLSYLSRMDVFYPYYRAQAPMLASYFTELAFDFSYFMLAMSSGYLVAIFLSKTSRNTFFAVVISAIILFLLIIPFLDRVIFNYGLSNLWNAVNGAAMGINANSPYLGSLTLFLFCGLINLVVWLNLRWMPIRP